MVYENRSLRPIYGPKKDENGKWRRFHNEELHGSYRPIIHYLLWYFVFRHPISTIL